MRLIERNRLCFVRIRNIINTFFLSVRTEFLRTQRRKLSCNAEQKENCHVIYISVVESCHLVKIESINRLKYERTYEFSTLRVCEKLR